MTAQVIYDGECPFCAGYVRLIRLREAIGTVDLVNARERPDLVEELSAHGIDLDEGMVLIWNGETFHGAECIERMALLSTPSGAFNRLNRFIFSRAALAALLYPVLRAGRNFYLRAARISRIGAGTS
jgi:predicted DCC family thiol-disulfide oxidoreductase YuxK